MKNKSVFKNSRIILGIMVASVSFALASCNKEDDTKNQSPAKETWELEVEELRNSVAPFHNFDSATAAGYNLDLTGYRTQMGYHYIHLGLLDDKFELSKPEVLLFAHDGAGDLQFVGVEYATVITDMNNPPPAPEGFSGDVDVWAINTEFNVWTLHVWVGMENPKGLFEAMNPVLP